MAGNHKKYTVYLTPEDINRLKEVADDIGLSDAETCRWFFQHMFKLYEEGSDQKRSQGSSKEG